jgi:hypothetical protein
MGVAASPVKARDKSVKRIIYLNGRRPEKPPLFNGTMAYGNLVLSRNIHRRFGGFTAWSLRLNSANGE